MVQKAHITLAIGGQINTTDIYRPPQTLSLSPSPLPSHRSSSPPTLRSAPLSCAYLIRPTATATASPLPCASVSPTQLPLLSSPLPRPAASKPGTIIGWVGCGLVVVALPPPLSLPSSSSGDGARAPALLSPCLPFRRGRLVR
jgi:hypothetical protein